MGLNLLSRFPGGSGRLLGIETQDGETVVHFAADPRGGPEALWFHIRLKESEPATVAPETKLRVVLHHVENMLGGHDPTALVPVVRSGGQTWIRLRRGTPQRQPDGQITASWTLKYPDPETDIAICFPYGRAELDTLVRKSSGYWRTDPVGVTTGGRSLVRISNDYGEPGGKHPGIYLMARQHAGETPGSWVLDGFLEEISRLKHRGVVVWGIPFADPDSLEEGAYGKDRFPYDLNRAWGVPPMRHESLAIKHDLRRWKERCHPALALDLHAPGACETDGIYTFTFTSDASPDLLKESDKWANILGDALAPEFAAANFKRQADYPSRWTTPTFTRCALEQFGVPALTLEIPYALAREEILTQKSYRLAGKRIATAVLNRIRNR